MVDSRVEQPARQAIEDLANGQIDAGTALGTDRRLLGQAPAGAAHASPRSRRSAHRPASRLPHLHGPASQRARVEASRQRPDPRAAAPDPGDPARLWRAAARRAGQPDHAGPSTAVPTSTVPEPAGYRMDKYRAPVPATLAGATVLSTTALEKADRRASAGAGRRPPQAAQAQGPRPEPALDRAQARAYRGLGLAAQCRLRRAVAGLHRLLPRPSSPSSPAATRPGRSCSTATPIAGCPGTPPSGRWSSSATPRSTGTRKAIQGWQKSGRQMTEAQEISMPDFQH